VILGENIHEEILKRSFPLFKFYSIKKAGLDKKIYDALLKNWNDKHESISLKIEDLICDILPFISKQDKRYLFQKINELKNTSLSNSKESDINLNFLNFLKKFTIKCLNNESQESIQYNNLNNISKNDFISKDNIYYGVDIFWELLNDINGKRLRNMNNINIIFNSFVEILESTNDISIKENYLDKCFSNIHHKESTIQSLKLIKIIYKSFIKTSINDINSLNVLKNISCKYNLLEIILSDFQRYMLVVREKVKLNGIIYKNSDMYSSEIFEGLFTHSENINVRLDLLYFICSDLNEFNQSFNPEHLEVVWKLLYKEAMNDYENNMLYKFLGNRGIEYK